MSLKTEESNVYGQILSYLRTKIASINLKTNRGQNTGGILIASTEGWVDKLPLVVELAVDVLQTKLQHPTSSSPAGVSPLTPTIFALGRIAEEVYGFQNLTWETHMRIGGLIVEAFYQKGLIDIKRDEAFSEYNNRAPYVVYASGSWIDFMDNDMISDNLKHTHTQPITHNNRVKYVKVDNTELQLEVKGDTKSPYKKGLDVIEGTGWKVNSEVNRIIEENTHLYTNPYIPVFNGDGDEYQYNCLLDPEDQTFPIDELVDSKGQPFRPHLGSKLKVKKAFEKLSNTKKGSNSEKRITEEYNMEVINWNSKLSTLRIRSKIASFKLIMNKFRTLRDTDRFYSEFEFDWRGRGYYKEAFANYQDADVARGQLLFAEGKEMTDTGNYWLAVHTANSFNCALSIEELESLDYFEQDYATYLRDQGLTDISLDKMALDDRVRWVMSNMEWILQLARDEDLQQIIVSGAEKEITFLACCLEWKNAFDANDLGVPYISHLPVAMDAQNSGSQHYAALAKDESAAGFTGLKPCAFPEDFYLMVARDIISTEDWFFNNRPMKMKEIRKGITKRASMTRLYSAGADKISEHMFDDCYQAGLTDKYDIVMSDAKKLSKPLVKSIDAKNPGASAVMKYLQNLTAQELGTYGFFDSDGNELNKGDVFELRKTIYDLSKSDEEEDKKRLAILEEENARIKRKLVTGNGKVQICWKTPSGFPVVFQSFKKKQVKARVSIKGLGRINLIGQIDTEIPDIRSFMSGISPDFIHSQDSAHLLLTAVGMDDRGVSNFGAIHDSFSTLAEDVPLMLEVAKEEFIKMYDMEDPMSYLKNCILSSEENVKLPPIPEVGDLDIKGIRESDYFFS